MKDAMKGIGTGIAILGTIGAIFFASNLNDIGEALYIEGLGIRGFFAIITIVAINAMLFFGLGAILENQERIEKLISSTSASVKKDTVSSVQFLQKEDAKPTIQPNAKTILQNKTFEGAPIVIRSAELIKHKDYTRIRIKIQNISQQTITACKVLISGRNSLLEEIPCVGEYLFSEMEIAPNQAFGEDVEIDLSPASIVDVTVYTEVIVFINNTKWTRQSAEMIDYIPITKFDSANLLYEAEKCDTALEILILLKGIGEDNYGMAQLIPEVQELARAERMYGNMRKSAIHKIKSHIDNGDFLLPVNATKSAEPQPAPEPKPQPAPKPQPEPAPINTQKSEPAPVATSSPEPVNIQKPAPEPKPEPAPSAKICPQCGNRISDDFIFCIKCGHKLV